MRFTQFKIKNFKGIEDITFNLDKSPNANIYTLVGLNESGKTTILEAINQFTLEDAKVSLGNFDFTTDYNSFIPISKRANFNEEIEIKVDLLLEDDDIKKINEFLEKETPFREVKTKDIVSYSRKYKYENSIYTSLNRTWSGFDGILKDSESDHYVHIGGEEYSKYNSVLARFCRTLIPHIIYFPNFLFDFPPRVYLESTDKVNSKEVIYIELIQDILNSLENGSTISIHLTDRIKSDDQNKRRGLNSLIQQMEKKVSEVIFDAWGKIFKRNIKDTRIKIHYNVDGQNRAFLEFEIEAQDGIYQLTERSLGFKWFFIFLLFTQFRPYRKESPQNIIFLFDEPASNLHSNAQQQLLKSFANLPSNCKIIYTTHSHYLINPHWLESTYVVKNNGLNLDNTDNYNVRKTNISIQSYREFVVAHPHNTAYFQPILDVLDYAPSELENVPNCIFLEGKNDYYTLSYFKDVILKSQYDIHMAPSTGSGNMDTLISLYLGWGKEFIILLDSDKAGHNEKDRYIEKFGAILEGRVYLLSDIDNNWIKKAIESLFNNLDALNLQTSKYPNTSTFNKTHFNRVIQENLINNVIFDFSEETKNNFSRVLDFLKEKIDPNI